MAIKNAFISYRRADTKNLTQSLYKDLIREFSENQVFMDVDDILPGTDFIDEINRRLSNTHAMLVMIGPEWAGLENDAGQRRLFEPNDFVRLEIEQAIKKKIRIFPVLVDNATMPSEQELPESIQSLSRLHALSLSSKDFKYQQHQVQQIINTLAPILDPINTRHHVAAKPKKTFGQKIVRVFTWIGFIFVGLIGISMLLPDLDPENTIATDSLPQPVIPSLPSDTIGTSIDINGTWHDEFGGQYLFNQSGTVFSLELRKGTFREQTAGSIGGDIIYFVSGQGTLEADKRHMQVAMNDGTKFRLHKGHLPQ